jgi:hypothetical protein
VIPATEDDRAANRRGLKVHLRVLAIAGTTYRVVSLRPQTKVRFSTNYFHDTWHILTGCGGAALLGRLLWGLAFQRQPGTLIWIDAPHVVTTPFEADRADPIVIVPAGLTRFEPDHLRALRRRLRDGGPVTSIRWHTFGLPDMLDDVDRWRSWRWKEHRAARARERMSRTAGLVCYTAPPVLLRSDGAGVYAMRHATQGSYHPLASGHDRWSWGPDGEVQVIPRFEDDVAAAAVARREVLGAGDAHIVDADQRWAVWDRLDEVRARRRLARTSRP